MARTNDLGRMSPEDMITLQKTMRMLSSIMGRAGVTNEYSRNSRSLRRSYDYDEDYTSGNAVKDQDIGLTAAEKSVQSKFQQTLKDLSASVSNAQKVLEDKPKEYEVSLTEERNKYAKIVKQNTELRRQIAAAKVKKDTEAVEQLTSQLNKGLSQQSEQFEWMQKASIFAQAAETVKLDTERINNLRKEQQDTMKRVRDSFMKNSTVYELLRFYERQVDDIEAAKKSVEEKLTAGIDDKGQPLSDEEKDNLNKQLLELRKQYNETEAQRIKKQRAINLTHSMETRMRDYRYDVDKAKTDRDAQINSVDKADPRYTENKRKAQDEYTLRVKTAAEEQGFSGKFNQKVLKNLPGVESVSTVIGNALSGGLGGIGKALSGGLDSLLGKAGPIASVLTAIMKIVSGINSAVSQGVTKAVNAQTQYMGRINTRLQSIGDQTHNYYNDWMDWSQESNDVQGKTAHAIGDMNAYVNKTDYVTKLSDLVNSGIAYNVEERALLASISDRMVTTFDAMDRTLSRLIRIQQTDSTYAALGSEALLTQFLNQYFNDTSYLSDVYDSVSSTLIDSVSMMQPEDSTEFMYTVQKWLASLYSVGMSDSGVQKLATGISYLSTGNSSAFTSDTSTSYIFTQAADRAGMSIADILIQGLDSETTNELLKSVVSLLQDIYENNQENKAVTSAFSSISNMSISDLRSVTNLTDDLVTLISNETTTWANSIIETQQQLDLMTDNSRTNTATKMQNVIDNALFTVGQNLISSTMNGFVANLFGVQGESSYLTYYIGQQMGGTVGTILTSLATIPAIKSTLQQKNIYDSDTGVNENIFDATNNIKSVYANLFELLTNEKARGIAQGVSDSSVSTIYGLSAKTAEATASTKSTGGAKNSSLMPVAYAMNTQNLWESVQANYKMQNNISNQLDELAYTLDEYDTLQSTYATTSVLSNSLVKAASVASASEEDKSLIDTTDNTYSYLFENESTIRVTLARVEDDCKNQLVSALKIEERFTNDQEVQNSTSTIKDMLENGSIKVDIIDSDVNSITSALQNIRFTY